MMRDVVAIHNIFSHLLILLHNYCIALPLESLSVYGTKSIRNVSTSLFPKSSKHAKFPMQSVPFTVNIISFVLPLVLAIIFTQHTVWKSIWYVLCPVYPKAKSFFKKEPSSDSTSQGENGVSWLILTRTRGISARISKNETWVMRENTLSSSLYVHRWSGKIRAQMVIAGKNSIEIPSVLFIREITRNQNKRSHTDRHSSVLLSTTTHI